MNKVQIYGILNVTPDSFSDGGKYVDTDTALSHALKMRDEGADVIDIGGMSTRPGFTDISAEEEAARVVPVIKELKKADPSVVISVDTFRASVAERAIGAGADIINDITGLMGDKDMASVISGSGVTAVLMRDGFGNPDVSWETAMQKTVDAASGIDDTKIILDPGVGFTRTREQDIELIKAIPGIIGKWGYPVLLGVSRKRITSGFYISDTVPEDRVGASIALALRGIELGASYVRVHDVAQTKAAINAYERLS